MKGKIVQWNDEKGFGFITNHDLSERVFFHISALKHRERRPQVQDAVIFEVMIDNQQRMKATEVYYEGLTLQAVKPAAKKPPQHARQSYDQRIVLEPKQRTTIDHVLLLIAVLFLASAGLLFFKTNNVATAIPLGIPALFLWGIYNRQKTPASKLFTCNHCRCNTPFDSRTIRAWNMGAIKLYCSRCHAEWLRNRNSGYDNSYTSSNKGGGCLGALLLILALPISLIVISQWFI
jgi:cold shock CspA family protein